MVTVPTSRPSKFSEPVESMQEQYTTLLVLIAVVLMLNAVGYGIYLFQKETLKVRAKHQMAIRRLWDSLVAEVLENPSNDLLHRRVLEFIKIGRAHV